ncbi:hypothetical protein ACLMJK_000617 [Lecanora helva]
MDSRTIGILGGGQLGRMLVEAANNRNISVKVLDKEHSPAKQINGPHPGVNGSFADPDAIRKLAEGCDILTVEIEHVDTYVLEELEKEAHEKGKKLEIHPSWHAIRTIQDKYKQKETLEEGGVKIAESRAISDASIPSLQQTSQQMGFPFMLKARTEAYDGRGNYAVRSADDFSAALEALKGRPLYAERWVSFSKELAVMVVKTDNDANSDNWESATLAYPVVETVHQNSILSKLNAPARGIPSTIRQKAQDLARRAVASFKGKGIFGVEMFLDENNDILVNEIAPRPHNSGHYTIEGCRLSQFDTHLLSILGRRIPPKSLELLKPAVMLNILGGTDPKSYLALANEADAIGAKVHLYGKGDATKGRKMGHLTLLEDTMAEAEDVIEPLIAMADQIRAGEEPRRIPVLTPRKHQPLVGIISGSISDQEQLEPCYKILEGFGIPFEKGIKSAHRTPDPMAEYGKSAAERGLKVIIAAAGGAAHLPGMVAAYARTVPVIGLPIKPSIGDGMDSLLSITNMPNGVSVMAVGVNKAVNAALQAAKQLAVHDESIREKLEEYLDRQERESLANDEKLQEENSRRLVG